MLLCDMEELPRGDNLMSDTGSISPRRIASEATLPAVIGPATDMQQVQVGKNAPRAPEQRQVSYMGTQERLATLALDPQYIRLSREVRAQPNQYRLEYLERLSTEVTELLNNDNTAVQARENFLAARAELGEHTHALKALTNKGSDYQEICEALVPGEAIVRYAIMVEAESRYPGASAVLMREKYVADQLSEYAKSDDPNEAWPLDGTGGTEQSRAFHNAGMAAAVAYPTVHTLMEQYVKAREGCGSITDAAFRHSKNSRDRAIFTYRVLLSENQQNVDMDEGNEEIDALTNGFDREAVDVVAGAITSFQGFTIAST